MIPHQSSGNAPKIQHRLIGRYFTLKLGFVNLLLEVSPREYQPRVSLSGDAVFQLPFHWGSLLPMELARFPISLRSRCGRRAQLSLRASPLCRAFLLLVKCLSLRRECLEKVFRAACRREPHAESFLRWRACLAIWPAKPMFEAGEIWLRETMKLPPVSWGQPAKQSYRLLPLRLLPRPLLWWRRLL